jgi:hypothetical protein
VEDNSGFHGEIKECYNGMEELMMDLFPHETKPASNTVAPASPNEPSEVEPNAKVLQSSTNCLKT